MKKIFIWLFAASPLVFTACDKQDTSGKPLNFDLSKIYVAGYHNNTNNVHVATVWNNGKATPLSDGKTNTVAYSIAVVGGKTYVAGMEIENRVSKAVLWIDGVKQTLPSPADNSTANSVYVVGTDVYVAGIENSAEPDTDRNAVLWVNGERRTLGTAEAETSASSVFATTEHIYVAGSRFDATGLNPAALLWTDGAAEALASGSNPASAFSVFAADGTVYAAGYQIGQTPIKSVPTLWTNGIAQRISDEAGLLNSVYVSGMDVYSGGISLEGIETEARLWKNGVSQHLIGLKQGERSAITSVCADERSFYAVGNDGDKAVLWLSDLRYALTDGRKPAEAYAVCIAR